MFKGRMAYMNSLIVTNVYIIRRISFVYSLLQLYVELEDDTDILNCSRMLN